MKQKSYNESNPEKWELIDSEYLHNEPWLTVKKETLRMPDGKVVPDYYVLEYPNWVNIIAITKDKKFVMVRQYRPGIERTCYELCAGVCEKKDSSVMMSARRELLEETGYAGGSWKEFMCVAPNASATNNYSYCFIAENVEKVGEQSLDETEALTVHLLTFEEVRRLLESGEIIQATMAAPLWKYVALHEQ